MKRVDELTGLRSVAVGMVVLGHSRDFLPHWASGAFSPLVLLGSGEMGVHIFFVLSGFLITSLLLREREAGRIDFLAFYKRRLLRIAPAFYSFLLILACLAVAGLLKVSWQQFVIAGTYLWNYARLLGLDGSYASHPDGIWYLGHTWSLALEEQFYWLWPALLWLMLKRPSRWALPVMILAVPLVSMASYVLFPALRTQQDMMFHTACDYVLVGCFVAFHQQSVEARLRPVIKSGFCFSLLALLVVLVLPNLTPAFGGYWRASYGRTIEAAAIGLLLLCILSQPGHPLCRVLRLRPVVFIGTISYGLYLWQQLFNWSTSPVLMAFPLNIVGAVFVATISYYVIERPFLRLKDRGRALNAVPAGTLLGEPER